MGMMTMSTAERAMQAAAGEQMRVAVERSGDVLVVHAAGTIAEGHLAARALPGFRIIDTFRDGWGRIVTRGVAAAV